MIPPPGYSNAQLIFEDTFSGPLDLGKWNPGFGFQNFGRSTGGGALPAPFSGQPPNGNNAEYCDPAQIITGAPGLQLVAVPSTTFSGYTWKSGCISTYQKFVTPPDGFYAQFSAKQPDTASGMWPALWFLDQDNTNEFDLQEGGMTNGVPFNQMLASTLHQNNVQTASARINANTDLSAGFHIYGIEYISGTSVKIYFDGQLINTFSTSIPTSRAFQILIELAVFQNDVWHSVQSALTPNPGIFYCNDVQVFHI